MIWKCVALQEAQGFGPWNFLPQHRLMGGMGADGTKKWMLGSKRESYAAICISIDTYHIISIYVYIYIMYG